LLRGIGKAFFLRIEELRAKIDTALQSLHDEVGQVAGMIRSAAEGHSCHFSGASFLADELSS
jgi:hypothetical protein